LLIQGSDQTRIPIERTPFSVGRKTDKELVLADPRVSRDHAQIVLEGSDFWLIDQGSKHGTFVNGQRIERHKLQSNDRLEFGAQDRVYVLFNPDRAETNAAREFLSQISVMSMPSMAGQGAAGDLEKLKLFLEAARKLNTSGVLDEVLVTLIDTTLRLTHAERGFVFLRSRDGDLRLAAGRNSRGELLLDDKTISHSILDDAVNSASEFLVTDTSKQTELASRNSIIAYDLRMVICIPLRRTQMAKDKSDSGANEILGVLYIDSRFASREISAVSQDVLRAIATEAASLVENANLVQAEAAARAYQQEMAIAASIQQRLMAVTIPDVPFASLKARNISCKEVGGDFYDVVLAGEGMAVVLTDVSGKGITSAILGATLQGLIFSQLTAGVSLVDIVSAANTYLCTKMQGEKYATLVLAYLHKNGDLEFVNCGHVRPVLVSGGAITRPEEGNLPVGLLSVATYEIARYKMAPGDRLIVVTDGVTEAEDASGEFFGNERLEKSAASPNAFEQIFQDVSAYCGAVPLNDDCSVVELTYKG
jgi:serine phosphatase RsbU (regulator of sigma subunit)